MCPVLCSKQNKKTEFVHLVMKNLYWCSVHFSFSDFIFLLYHKEINQRERKCFIFPRVYKKMRKKKCLFSWNLIPAVVVEDLSNSHYELGASILQIHQHRLVTSVDNVNYTFKTWEIYEVKNKSFHSTWITVHIYYPLLSSYASTVAFYDRKMIPYTATFK